MDTSAPALHRLAPVVHRRRRLPRPVCQHDPFAGDSPGLLLCCRDRSSCSRRAERPAAADATGSEYLVAATVIGLVAAVALGAIGVTRTGWVLVPFIVVGPLIVIAYNAELFGGVLHNDVGFAVGWGAFPVLTAYVAQTKTLAWAPVFGSPGGVRALGRTAAPEHAGAEAAPPDRTGRGSSHCLEWRGASDRSAVTCSPPSRARCRLSSGRRSCSLTALAVARLA